MELRDQDFRVGDEVVIVYSPLRVECGKVVCLRAHQLSEEVLIKRAPLEHTTGDLKGLIFGNRLSPVYFFHRDAITIDEHGRLTAINHDYVKERAPKIVTKEPHEFKPFERVLVREFKEDEWCCDMFSHYDEEEDCSFICIGANWKSCIPFAGNEHLVGKVTE